MQIDDKRHFDTGAARDSEDGKEDYIETISWATMKRYAEYMTGKKKKYGEWNWKKGIPIDSYERSLVRHLQKYLENKYEGGTVETEEDHLSAMLFNVFGIMYEESKKHKKDIEEIVPQKNVKEIVPLEAKEVMCGRCGKKGHSCSFLSDKTFSTGYVCMKCFMHIQPPHSRFYYTWY